MECKPSESLEVQKVFECPKRKRGRRKRDGGDYNSVVTEGSSQGSCNRIRSNRASLQNMTSTRNICVSPEGNKAKRDHDSSPSLSRTPDRPRSPRRNRRPKREGISLALKAGAVDTPRSESPAQDANNSEFLPKGQDSLIFAFLEEAIKKDRRKKQHRLYEEEKKKNKEKRERTSEVGNEHARDRTRTREPICDEDAKRTHSSHRSPQRSPRRRSGSRRHSHRHHTPCKHRHRHRHDKNDSDCTPKEGSPEPAKDPMALLETFAKLCVKLNEKTTTPEDNNQQTVTRTQSHKSMQCADANRNEKSEATNYPLNLTKCYPSPENIPSSRVRSHDNFQDRILNNESDPTQNVPFERPSAVGLRNNRGPYDRDAYQYQSNRLDNIESRSRMERDVYRGYPTNLAATGSRMDYGYRPSRMSVDREYNPHRNMSRKQFEEERKNFEQKTSRSFDVPRDGYGEEKGYRRTARSETTKAYDIRSKRFDDREKYENARRNERERQYNLGLGNRERDHRSKAFDKSSIASREDDFPYKDRMSERERDSGLSVADGETSTVSGKSNCLKVVKQEIAEQREAMDKMMKLWKELMRCFKTLSPPQQETTTEKKANVNCPMSQESATAQFQLWRECMRRYETVARDVGDTDARLMEEINKQRSEMAEMATMWQECLQRYRDISDDFNNLKQKLSAPAESPTRVPVPPPTQRLVNCEAEGSLPPAPYRVPASYPSMPPMAGYGCGGSPIRSRPSMPPAWWWPNEGPPSPRHRHDSPEAHRHKERDRERSRYKEKPSKPNGARSEHRHRKR